MFTMMNHARLGVGLQGLGLSELVLAGIAGLCAAIGCRAVR